MKTRTQFICELCNTTYAAPEEAMKCEKAHVKPVIDGPLDPKPEYEHGAKYPRVIQIGFEDGEIRKYKLVMNWHDDEPPF